LIAFETISSRRIAARRHFVIVAKVEPVNLVSESIDERNTAPKPYNGLGSYYYIKIYYKINDLNA